jgi:hypothetical protein
MWSFGTSSDDGSNLYIENTRVVNNDGLHGTSEKKGNFNAPQTGLYKIRAEFFENDGHAAMSASMGGPGLNYQRIPANRLFTVAQCLESMPDCTNTCWDSSAPNKAAGCSCPAEPAACENVCWDESTADKFNNCACPAKPSANWPAVFDDIHHETDFKDLHGKWTNDADLQAYCDSMAQKTFDEWKRIKDIQKALPEVCEDGQACRDGIWADALNAMKGECVATVNDIKEMVDNSWTNSKRILEEGYKEEFVCDPACYCEDIEQSYIDHVRLEREIEREIDDIEEEIKDLVQQRKDVIVNCPDYEESQYIIPDGILV